MSLCYYSRGQIGNSFQILCESHPNITKNIESPKEFKEFSPDGGCDVNVLLNYGLNFKSLLTKFSNSFI